MALLVALEDSRRVLLENLVREPTLEEWAEQASLSTTALRERIDRGRRAKEKLVESNLRLVYSLANRYANRGVTIQDLVQEGALGLIRATEKFNPRKGVSSNTTDPFTPRGKSSFTSALTNDPSFLTVVSANHFFSISKGSILLLCRVLDFALFPRSNQQRFSHNSPPPVVS